MNKKVLVIASVFILSLLGYFVGCPSPATSNTLDASFENIPQSSKSIKAVDIFFDASTSMKGYFASGDGQISNVVSRFEKIGDDSKMFLIGKNNSVKPYAGYSTNLQNNLSLFDGGSTHFEKLIPIPKT